MKFDWKYCFAGWIFLGCMQLGSIAQTKVACIAHRGGRALAPENTLAALREGMKYDVEYLEIDVHQTLDSVVVVSHDETLDRCTDGHGRIDKTAFAEIRKLDAGAWFDPKFKGEKVPTLEEVLDLVDGKHKLWIELKAGGDYPGIEKRIVNLIHAKKAENWAQVISFDTEALRNIHELDSQIVLHKLLVSNLTLLPWYLDTQLHWGNPRRISFVNGFLYHHRFVRKSLVKKFHGRGKTLMVWTVNKPKRIKALERMGVDGIETDVPALMRPLE
jgi:glycerophosphoryl diester phosphodiesterase